MASPNRNEYLDQVMAQQVQLEQDLRSKRSTAPAAAMPMGLSPGASPPSPARQEVSANVDRSAANGPVVLDTRYWAVAVEPPS